MTKHSVAVSEVLDDANLLSVILRACVLGPGRAANLSGDLAIRLVSRAWKAACDEMLRAQVKEVVLSRTIQLGADQCTLRAVEVAKSSLIRCLAGASVASISLLARKVVLEQCQATVALNAFVLQSIPALQELTLSLRASMAASVDRMLPRTTHLTKLAINFTFKSGYADGSCYDVEDALVYGLQHLQGLRDLTLDGLPSEVGLQSMAAVLPVGLTALQLSYDFQWAESPAEQHLKHLACLTSLERLAISGCLRGPQALPGALSRLTHLDLSGNSVIDFEPSLQLDFSAGGAVPLRRLVLTGAEQAAWPEGLHTLTRLQSLEMRRFDFEALPGHLALPASLVELVASGAQCACGCHITAMPLPDLSGLKHLQRLECELCQPDALVSALPALSSLTALSMTRCYGMGMGQGGQAIKLGSLTALQALSIQSCALAAYPQGLKACTQLSRLVLSGNPTLGSKQRLSLVGLSGLRHLALARCGLKQLPTGMTKLGSLETLDVTGNLIQTSRPEARWLEAQFEMPQEGAEAAESESWVYRRRKA